MQRWWAPQRPTVEPDAVVLAMLEPGDLGSALLAAHRAGAAAIETVSKAALPTEEGLVSAMLESRTRAADKVVDSIAKAVPSPSYAALLVRDVMDDAELGVLTIYRTAVNKGVSPPIAASRAAAIYGVPASAMGRYTQLATDPRSNPVAVLDAADRTLMSYVAKLVTQETEAYEEVSKSPNTGAQQPWDESEVRRDARGRFAEEHGGTAAQRAPQGHPPRKIDRIREFLGLRTQQQGPDRVADILAKPAEPERQEAPPEAERATPTVRARPEAVRRASRVRRTSTTGPQRQAAARAGRATRASTATRQRSTRRATAAERVALAKRDVEMQRVAEAINATDRDHLLPVPVAPVSGTVLPGLLEDRWGEVMAYGLEEHAYTVTLDREAAARLLTSATMESQGRARPNERVFRMGHLLDAAAAPAQVSDSTDADSTLTGVAAMARDENQPAPSAQIIRPDRLKNPAETDAEFLERERGRTATRRTLMPDGSYRETIDYEELNAIHVLPVYTKFGAMQTDETGSAIMDREYALVHFQRRTDEPSQRNIPTVDEFVVVRGARGNEEGPSPRHMVTHLDPSQAYRLVNAPTERPGSRIKPQTFWDPTNEVRVNRWFIEPIDDVDVDDIVGGRGVTKAAGAYQSDPEFERKHPRDAKGQFVEAYLRRSLPSTSSLPEPVEREATAVTRTGGVTRTRRVTRTSRPIASRTTQATRRGAQRGRQATRASSVERSKIGNAIRAASAERMLELSQQEPTKFREMPVLDDRNRYIVLPAHVAQRMIGDEHDQVLPVRARLAAMLSDRPLQTGDDVVLDLSVNVQHEIEANEGRALDGFTWNRRPAGRGLLRTDEDHVALGQRIRQIFESRPEIAQIHVDYSSRPGEYQLYANTKPVGTQVIIETEDDLDWNRPMTLVPLGHYKSSDMRLQRRMPNGGTYLTDAMLGEDDEDPTPVNVNIQQYRLQNAPVVRYRLEND